MLATMTLDGYQRRRIGVPASPTPIEKSLTVSKLQKLRDAKTLEDVAKMLGLHAERPLIHPLQAPGLKEIYFVRDPEAGWRQAPDQGAGTEAGTAAERLATLLNECLEELKRAPPPRRSLAHGFEKKGSIITNANLHKRRRYVLNLDLEDFFPSINFGRVRGFFLKDKHFSLHRRSPRSWPR